MDKFKPRLFVILWIAGMTGVLSFLLVDLSALLSNLPAEALADSPFSPFVLKLISTLQTSVLLSIAVVVGIALADKVGLSSPAAEALARKGNPLAALKPQIVPGIIGGLVGGIAIALAWVLWQPFLSPNFRVASRAVERTSSIPDPRAVRRHH